VSAVLASHAGARHEPPFPAVLVEEMLRQLVKAVRAHQLYLPNNPMHARAVEMARATFAPLWQHTDRLVLQVGETELTWEGRAVLSEAEKAGDGLPWLLYKDGVRELQIGPGFENELSAFLDIVQRVRRAAPEEDDLLTLLWESDFSALRYRHVELPVEGATPLGEPTARAGQSAGTWAADEELTDGGTQSVVNLEDFDSTLYFLDESEVAYVRDEVAREYAGDLRQNVLAILFDIFDRQADTVTRDEVCAILDGLMLHLLSAGELRAVAYLLREALGASGQTEGLQAAHRTHLTALSDRLSGAEVLSQLLQALDEAADVPPREELSDLFGQLRPTALRTTLAWLGRLQNPQLRALLEAAADRMVASNTAELVRLIADPEHAVALAAARRAGSLKSPAAVPPLTRVLAEGDAALRLAAVQALGEIASPGALQALERAVEDAERDVRVAAVRAIAQRSYRPGLPRVEAVVKGKTLREADLTERMAFFETYGALCGDAGVPLLDGFLNGKGFLGRREDSELRACAAVALGRIGTPPAQEALQRAAADKEVVVRSAVNRALRGSAA
jgi:hypothetical protein